MWLGQMYDIGMFMHSSNSMPPADNEDSDGSGSGSESADATSASDDVSLRS